VGLMLKFCRGQFKESFEEQRAAIVRELKYIGELEFNFENMVRKMKESRVAESK